MKIFLQFPQHVNINKHFHGVFIYELLLHKRMTVARVGFTLLWLGPI